jgi:hypothetical protein
MGKILLVAIILSHPILSFIALMFVLAVISVIVDLMGNALDAARARIKKLFAKK